MTIHKILLHKNIIKYSYYTSIYENESLFADNQ